MLPATVWLTYAFVFGAIIGSFLNVVAYRLPRKRSIVFPPSGCPACSSPIQWFDNIPILSFLLLRGRCRRCQAVIPLHYPLVELGCALLSVAVARQANGIGDYFYYFLFVAILITVTLTDLQFKIIPNKISYPGVVLGVGASVMTSDHSLISALLGVLIGGGLFMLVAELFYRLRGIEGLMYGDVKLMAVIGAFLGARPLIWVILCGSASGLIIGWPLVSFRYEGKTAIPFGPFLVLGALIALFFEDTLCRLAFGAECRAIFHR